MKKWNQQQNSYTRRENHRTTMKTAKRKVADMEISTDDESDEPCNSSSSSSSGDGSGSSSGNTDRNTDAKWSTQPQCQDHARQQQRGEGVGGGEQTSREIGSVRELNRLLESALRIGRDDSYAPGDAGISSSGHSIGGSAGAASQADAAASWRLDTARRLSSVSVAVLAIFLSFDLSLFGVQTSFSLSLSYVFVFADILLHCENEIIFVSYIEI